MYECVRARITLKNIAAAVGIDVKTLNKHYATEIKEGRNYLPALASSKIVEFLEMPAEKVLIKGKGKGATTVTVSDNDIKKEQANLAYKVMSRHGWADSVDVKADRPLVRIVTNRLPEDKDDV